MTPHVQIHAEVTTMREFLIVISIAAIFVVGDAVAADEAQKVDTAKKKAGVLEKKAAGEGSKAEHPSPAATIKKTEAQAVDPVGEGSLNDALTCLSRTIYWEARGEGTAGMEAIANVVMNRLGHEGFPDKVCKVVKEGSEKGDCQFSWWCDQRSDGAKDSKSYALAKEISRRALNRQLPDRTGGALYFHQRKVTPSWSKKYIKTVRIGKFVFYKPHGVTAK
jgi:spore germination cell wall hydrolase CwlJ-like protein